jgi:hypothetical protein
LHIIPAHIVTTHQEMDIPSVAMKQAGGLYEVTMILLWVKAAH